MAANTRIDDGYDEITRILRQLGIVPEGESRLERTARALAQMEWSLARQTGIPGQRERRNK